MDELLSVLVPRDFVQVEGADAASFLQGQLSQDIQPLSVGDSAWSFLLQPQGKVDAWLRVTRVADDGFVLDVDEGFADAVLDAAQPVQAPGEGRAVRARLALCRVPGPGAADEALTAAGASDSARAFAVDAAWPGIEAFDVIGPSDSVPDNEAAASIEQYERARIESGVPAMGRELTEATIPAESGVVARSVSFTKGCFTGQELVARIDSPRRQCASALASSAGRGCRAARRSSRAGRVATSAWSRAVPLSPTAASRSLSSPARSNRRPKCRSAGTVARPKAESTRFPPSPEPVRGGAVIVRCALRPQEDARVQDCCDREAHRSARQA